MWQKIAKQLLKLISFETILKYLKERFFTLEAGTETTLWIAKRITELTNTPIDNYVLAKLEPEIKELIKQIKENKSLSINEKISLIGGLFEKLGAALRESVAKQ